MAEFPANEDEAVFALALDGRQEGLHHHGVGHVGYRLASLQSVLAIGAGTDLAFEDEVVGLERVEGAGRARRIRLVQPDGGDDPRPARFEIPQIGLVNVPADEIDGIVEACGLSNPVERGEEFFLPVPIVPRCADDGGAVAAPVGVRVVPGDIHDRQAPGLEGRAQGVHHVVVLKCIIPSAGCSGKGDLRGDVGGFHGRAFSTLAGCVQRPALAMPPFSAGDSA